MSTTPPKRNAAGRKTRLTPERQDRICTLVRAGHYKRTAAQQAGIEERTLYQWYAKGDPAHPLHRRKYAQFRQALDKAEAESEVVLLDTVLKTNDPRMALEVLKRRFPTRWGDRTRLEHTGETDESGESKPIGVNHSGAIDTGAAVQIIFESPADVWDPDVDQAPEQSDAVEETGTGIEMPGDTDLG
jgi:transposase